MPQVSRHKKVSQGTRVGTDRRKARHRAVRQSGTQSANFPAVLSNTLHSLRLQKKFGLEVATARQTSKVGEGLLADLLRCYTEAYLCIEKGVPDWTEFDNIDTEARKVKYIFDAFGKLVPEDCYYNIEYEEDTIPYYYFTVYKLAAYESLWYALPVEEAVLKLKSQPKLYEVFLLFIDKLMEMTGIEAWWGSSMSSSMDHLLYGLQDCYDRDEEEEDKNDGPPAWVVSWEKDIKNYTNGKPAQFEKVIKSQYSVSVDYIIQKAKSLRIRKNKWLQDRIIKGCELLKQPYSINDFVYDPNQGIAHDGGFYLPVEMQFNIVWNYEDHVFCEQEEYLNSLANEGAQEPTIHMDIRPGVNDIDFSNLDIQNTWFYNLCELFNQLSNAKYQ